VIDDSTATRTVTPMPAADPSPPETTTRSSDYGSEGLGFESLQARRTERPFTSGYAGGGPFVIGVPPSPALTLC
jgi:hypothetical protein